MTPRRKIIAQLATSADSFIARPDGDFEWLNSFQGTGDYGMTSFYASIDTVLWGRKAYENAVAYQLKHGINHDVFDTTLTNYVFARRAAERSATSATFVS